MKPKRAVHVELVTVRFRAGKWEREERRRDVTVLAVVGSYAMVRCKGCRPYIAPTKELREIMN